MPAVVKVMKTDSTLITLIKPQFEAGKEEVDKGAGVITDANIHGRVIQELKTFVAAEIGLNWRGVTESPLLGPAGNKEFLVLIEKNG
jgi:23S rRNA (cytidine1920-2'-O)/16S rRNA (cytidine1409-2'-O)-methyltransferase